MYGLVKHAAWASFRKAARTCVEDAIEQGIYGRLMRCARPDQIMKESEIIWRDDIR